MPSRTPCRAAALTASLAVSVLLTGPAPGQSSPDLLKEQAARQKIAAENLENEVRDANSEASKVGPKDPAAALALLKAAKARLEADTLLPETRRADLLKSLTNRIGNFTARLNDQKTTPVPDASASAKREAEERKLREDEKLRQQLQEVDRLRRAGRTAEADFLMAQILQNNPSKPAAQGTSVVTSRAGIVAEQAELKRIREQNNLLVWNDVEKSATPPKGDVEFPRNWRELSAKRQRVQMTEEERKILKALNSPIDLEFKDAPLESIISYIEDKTGLKISVPKSILEEQMITYQTPVTVHLKGVSLRTALKKTLADLGLTYVIDKQLVQVTTPERAKLTLSTRVYYIGDLAQPVDFRLGYFGTQGQFFQNLNDIIGLIVTQVEPDSWWTKGGLGTITFDPRTMSLVIKQTAEMHFMLGASGLR